MCGVYVQCGAPCDTTQAANSELPQVRGAAPPFRSILSDPTARTSLNIDFYSMLYAICYMLLLAHGHNTHADVRV